jgi:hypothetical protein
MAKIEMEVQRTGTSVRCTSDNSVLTFATDVSLRCSFNRA